MLITGCGRTPSETAVPKAQNQIETQQSISADGVSESSEAVPQTSEAVSDQTEEVYTNSTYGLKVTLPAAWAGYKVDASTWEAQVLDKDYQLIEGQTVTGPMLTIQHPDSSEASPRQGIPILILTHDEAEAMASDATGLETYYHIGAAPIGPSILAENDAYVFALPARYNFADLEGTEEVNALIEEGAVTAEPIN